MKVYELIERLQNIDPNREVILQKDSEGNGYSPLAEIYDNATYAEDSTWGGEIGLEVLTPELEQQGFSEDDVLTEGVPALVLCPIN